MKNLKECLAASLATPGNTVGMGNASIANGEQLGTDLIVTGEPKKLKKKNKKNKANELQRNETSS